MQQAKEMTFDEVMLAIGADKERDFGARIPMSAVIKVMNTVVDIDHEVIGKLWGLRYENNSIFGYGYSEWAELEGSQAAVFLTITINAMNLMRENDQHPYDAMVNSIAYNHPHLSIDEIHNVMLNLVDCESLADFVYWCPVNDIKYFKRILL